MATIIDTNALAYDQATRTSDGEALGLISDLSAPSGLRHLRAHHEQLPEGRRSSPKHSHSAREELVYVLCGQVTLEAGATRRTSS